LPSTLGWVIQFFIKDSFLRESFQFSELSFQQSKAVTTDFEFGERRSDRGLLKTEN